MKKLVLASLFLAVSQMAVAVNWVNANANSVANNETNYIDFDSIQGYYFNNSDKVNYYITAWVKAVYPKLQTLEESGNKYKESVHLYYIDCNRNKVFNSEVHFYNASGIAVNGAKRHINTYSSDSWDKIIPGTVNYYLTKNICSMYQSK